MSKIYQADQFMTFTGGTGFLKADGSVDSTIYITGINNAITGNGTTNIISKFNGTSGITNSNILDNGSLVSISSNTIVIGAITGNSFVKTGGTSSQFLKADGSVDSSIYVTGISNNITGNGTTNIISKFNSLSGITNSNISDNGSLVSISSDTRVLGVFTANTIVKSGGTANQFLKADGSSDSTIYITGVPNNITGTGTNNIISKFNSSSGVTNSNISDNGTLVSISSDTRVLGVFTANTIVKSGGTSTQFLKADGSSDSTTYITGIPNVITGTGTNNIISKFNGASGITNSTITDTGTLVTITSNTNIIGNITATTLVKSGGLSTQFLKADGSIDSTTYNSGTGTTTFIPKFFSSNVLSNSAMYDDGDLVVVDRVGGAGYLIVKGISDGDNFAALEIDDRANTSKWQFSNKSADKTFQFAHNNGVSWSFPFSIKSNGNVLIGSVTDNGVDILQVGGSVISTIGYKVSGGTSSQFLKANGTLDSTSYYPASNPSGFTSGTSFTLSGGIVNNIAKWSSSSAITTSNISDTGILISLSSATRVLGVFTANTIVKSGGTSTQFLKADGSVDSTTYLTGIVNNITGTGTNNIISKFNSSSGITNSNITDTGALVTITSNTNVTGDVTITGKNLVSGAGNYFYMSQGSLGNKYISNKPGAGFFAQGIYGTAPNIRWGMGLTTDPTANPTGETVTIFDAGNVGIGNVIVNNGTDRLQVNGSVISSVGYKISGGTSSQFLKADGSVDSTLYYPASNPSGFTSGGTGSATLSGGIANNITKWSSSSAITNSNMSDTGVLVTISSNTRVIGAITATTIVKSGGTSAQFLMADGSVTTSTSSGVDGGGTINFIPKFTGTTSIGDSNISDNGTVITLSGPTLTTDGFTAVTIVKSGGTSSQFLMADGSVSTGGGGATLSGGVTNSIAKWSSSSAITTSNISDTGTLVKIAADTLITDGFTAYTIAISGGTNVQFLKADGTLDSNVYQLTLVSGTNIKTIDGGSILGSGDIPSKIVITPSATTISTNTTDISGNSQNGRTVMINNGSSAITINVSGGTMFTATYEKLGTGAITFVQGTGRVLNQVDATNILNGAAGSTASISSFNTNDNLRISNA